MGHAKHKGVLEHAQNTQIQIPGPEVIKLLFMLNSSKHKNFSANSWRFHIYKQGNFHAQLHLARKYLKLSVI